MRKFFEAIAVAATIIAGIIALLVLLYGDNWLGWHASTSALSNGSKPPKVKDEAPAALLPTTPTHPPLRSALEKPQTPPIVTRHVIVEEQPKETQPPSAGTTPNTADYVSSIVHKMRRDGVKSKATFDCELDNEKQSGTISEFVFKAAIAENQFNATRNSKVMISDLNEWLPLVFKYLNDNKATLPDISVFEIANASGNFGTFHHDGMKAWATMDAKRKALLAIQHEIEARPCDKIGKAAVADCEESGNCQVPQ